MHECASGPEASSVGCRLALLSNALSRSNRGGRWREHPVAQVQGVTHALTHSLDDLPAALDTLLASQPDVLAVNGGDGTLQTLLTACLRRGVLEQLPPLAVLAGGTTNMSARDLSGPVGWRRAERALVALVARPPATWPLVRRPVVQVEAADGSLFAGLFFGLGNLVRGVEFWQRTLRENPGAGEWGVGAAVTRTAWGIVRREPPFEGATRVQLHLDGAALAQTETSALMVTTLERLVLGMRPYWGNTTGPLACTWMDATPRQFLLRLPFLLWGQGERVAGDAGYHSARGSALRVELDEPWLLDGEVVRAPGPLAISATRPLRFVDLQGGRG